MNMEDILSGKAGLAGIHSALHGQPSRRLLRSEAQSMLRRGFRPGPFHLTRAKFKPDRELLAYFNFPALDSAGHASRLIHLAVAWRKHRDGNLCAQAWGRLQEEHDLSRLTPVQRELWKENMDQRLELQAWPFDPQFPQLARLGDPAYIAAILPSLGIAPASKHMPVITPIRYRPGERHVLRYEICPPGIPATRGQRIYAKLYSDPNDATRAFEVANRVVDWLAANCQGLQGNRPAAVSQRDGVVLYPHAPGIPLSRQLDRSSRWLATQLHAIGSALWALHNGPPSLQTALKNSTFAREVKVVKRASEHIQVLLPEIHARIIETVDRAEEHYSSLPQEDPMFTHSDFKADHLLTTSQGVTLIDFDTCTLTDPAVDIGKFLADLDWWFALKGIPGVEQAQAEFLKGYLGMGASSSAIPGRLSRARLYHVLILIKIIIRRVSIYRKDWAVATARMIEHAAGELKQEIAL